MNFGQSFRLALKSLMTSKMRALLTMLGTVSYTHLTLPTTPYV